MDSEGWTNVPTEIQICKANILHNPMEGETDLAKVSKDYKKIIHIAKERIRQLEGEALRKLRNNEQCRESRAYLV